MHCVGVAFTTPMKPGSMFSVLSAGMVVDLVLGERGDAQLCLVLGGRDWRQAYRDASIVGPH